MNRLLVTLAFVCLRGGEGRPLHCTVIAPCEQFAALANLVLEAEENAATNPEKLAYGRDLDFCRNSKKDSSVFD